MKTPKRRRAAEPGSSVERRAKTTGRSKAKKASPAAAKPEPGEPLPPDAEVEALRGELERRIAGRGPQRWNADPEDVQRSVAKLVLTLVDFLRQLMERQAIRRMENRSLRPEEVEKVGVALMRLEETVVELAARFGLEPADLNLDLGPLGKLK